MANTTAIRRQISAGFSSLNLQAGSTGSTWYVRSTTGTNGTGYGTDPSTPYATYAYALATGGVAAGDTVILLPDHAESIIAAAGWTLSVAGVDTIGLGHGARRPTFTFTTSTAAQVIVSGANAYFENVLFVAGIDAIVAMMSVTGAGFWMNKCDWTTNTGALGTVLGILTAATATGFKVTNCRFLGPATNTGTTVTACIKHEVGVDYEISDCYFTGKMTQAILNATTVLRGLIARNNFVIATGTKGVAMEASSTPFIVNNRFNVPSGTAPIVAAAGFVIGNLYSAAAGVTAPTAATF